MVHVDADALCVPPAGCAPPCDAEHHQVRISMPTGLDGGGTYGGYGICRRTFGGHGSHIEHMDGGGSERSKAWIEVGAWNGACGCKCFASVSSAVLHLSSSASVQHNSARKGACKCTAK
eukprot:scaffold297293_cov23-Tisochrysis_lutea.AAC.1